MRRIVVGYDGSAQGADALALGRALAELLETAPSAVDADVPVDIAIVVVFPDGSIGASGQRTLDGEHRRDADRILDGARRAWPELSPGAFRIVQAGSPAQGMQQLARDRDVDALVVGASRHSVPGRIFPGSVTEQTLHGSPCAVLVAPAGYASAPAPPLRRLGVAYDGSPEACAALAEAERLACGRTDVSVVAIDAADTVRELLDASRTLDLLLLGSREHGLLRRTLHGSVSTPVVRGASCPLLLLPHSSVVAHAQGRHSPDGASNPAP